MTRWIMLIALLALLFAPACSKPRETASNNDSSSVINTGQQQQQLKVVSHLNVAAGQNNITDLWAHTASNGKSYAYLGTYDEPACGPDISGIHVVDISDASHPVKAGFIPLPAGTRAGDVSLARIETAFFKGDVLVHAVELCRHSQPQRAPTESAGIVLYDVTDPLHFKRFAPGFSLGFEVHNAFVYHQGERAFVLVVQDDGERDFHIVEITDPSQPHEVSARGKMDWFDARTDQLALGEMPLSFLHDVWAQSYPASLPNTHYAGKTIAYLSYWDAGLVLLDITDPANPVFLGDSDYLDPDPLTGLPPEGNSHSAVPTADGNLVFMGDEDFSTSSSQSALSSPGTAGNGIAPKAVFDGWGYARVLDVSNPAKIVELGQYATENVLAQPAPPGDHSIHNIMVDGRVAYISWYADGIRVIDFSNPRKPAEIARFVDTAGSNFWGVYLFKHPDGNAYVLGSDRDTGLWILKLAH